MAEIEISGWKMKLESESRETGDVVRVEMSSPDMAVAPQSDKTAILTRRS